MRRRTLAFAIDELPDFSPDELEVRPLELSETIPSTWYTDPRFLELEKACIFGSSWQYAGHEERIPEVGQVMVAGIPGNPVIIVRGNDAAVRAFYNVCRHRGGPLATGDCHGRMLQCKYHGWTYTLEGQLRGVPKFDRTDLFDKRDFGLVPLSLSSWEGFLFVNPASGHPNLQTIMSGIRESMPDAPDLSAMKFYRRVEYGINCNWKVYVDNYLEGYHVPLVHPTLSSILDYQEYHTEVHEHYSLQRSPLSVDNRSYGIQGGGTAYYFHVFPNFMLNILPGRVQTNLVIPVTHRTTLVVFEYYYENVSSSEVAAIEEDIRYSDLVQKEDIAICEHVQRGLESVAYTKGRFSAEMECGVHHFQSWLKRSYSRAAMGSDQEHGGR